MMITFTASAVRKLAPYLADGALKLKLLYDAGGCGCGMSGIPALQLIAEPSGDDREGAGEPFPFYYNPYHAIYYDDALKVDFNETTGSFSLLSDSQIYTRNLRLIGLDKDIQPT